jgi:D-cysteine desulfhydrase
MGFDTLVIKRDDLNAEHIGGNKLRALEWILPAAGDGIVSLGGIGSTWCATLARYAREDGRRVATALFPQPWSPSVGRTLAVTAAHAEVRLLGSLIGVPGGVARAWLGLARECGRVTFVPAGGATPAGVLGSVNGALEFAGQVERGDAPRPDVVVVPLGSGGTTAGLLLGFDLAEWDITVCAVAVTSRWLTGTRAVGSLVRRTRGLLARAGAALPPRRARLEVLWNQLGHGYGHPTDAGRLARESMARVGIALESTYGAKAFAALAGIATSYRRPCFWHTFDQRLEAAPSVNADHPLLYRARLRAESLWPSPKST